MSELAFPTQQRPQHLPVNYSQNINQAMPQQHAYDDVNQLIHAAEPLLTLITQIRHTVDHPNVASLRNQIVEEVKNFERRLSAINYPMRTIIAARYCLCTAIDEAVLSQSWGTQSVWVQGSLLSLFQKETWGGERFYIILEDALRNIRNNIDFIELIYFLMSLGFEGKFFGDQYRAAREEIRNRIFYHIRHARAKPERSLSPHWKNISMPATVQQKKSLLKRVAIISIAVIVGLAIFYNVAVYRNAEPTLGQLSKLATISPITTFSEVIERPIVLRNDNRGEK